VRAFFRIAVLSFFFTLVLVVPSEGQNPSGPIPIDKAGSQTGKFQVLLAERSPLNKPADIAKRASQTTSAEPDYDLAKEPFEAYVPKSPADDGKYGLVVPMPFGGHGFPPQKWFDVLESRHLLWLGDSNAGEQRLVVVRIGLALDAVANAEKTWQIDPARVYMVPAAGHSAADAIALYYPDVFQGQISGGTWGWYAQIRTKGTIYHSDTFPPPKPEQLGLAKTRSRFFFAGRESSNPGKVSTEAAMVKDGYERAGFRHVKAIFLPAGEITVWSSYPASWFDQGIQFLDSGAAEANAQMAGAKSAASPATKASAGTAPPAVNPSTPDDPTKKAASALSLARNYVIANQYDAARKKLQSIIATYPNTPSAAEAKSLLKEIQDK